MAASRFFSNTAVQTTLAGNISSGATSITVNATTGFPALPYTLALDFGGSAEELVSVTAAASTTLTVVRAYGGTSAQSHSIGAVVRHVYDATEAAAFRTHEGATAAVHGLTGTVVGTSDVQTLGNKTLTAPAVTNPAITGGGSFAGTFTGTPTFSGNVTFSGATTALTASGEISHSNLYRGTRSLATDNQMETRVTADANARWFMRADGRQNWGPGSAGVDTNLYRASAAVLQTDGAFTATGTLTAAPSSVSADGLDVRLPSLTSNDLANYQVNAVTQAALDNNGAYRIYQGNTPNTYTPAVGSGGSATFSVQTGSWYRLGKIIFINIYLVVNATGSGTAPVTVSMPTNVDRSGRQIIGMHTESIGTSGNAASHIGGGEAVFFTGGTGAIADRLRTDEGASLGREGNVQGADLLSGGSITIQGWYREA